jgi:class 3 adenylate cyclase
MARLLLESVKQIDVRAVLPAISVPTLLLHRVGDSVPIGGARYISEHIPNATLVELPGRDHAAFEAGIFDRLVSDTERFLTGNSRATEPDRVLSTVLFTDIVKSTETASELGDHRWRSLLDDHNALMTGLLEQHRGRLVKQMGDGFLATFDGPARAIACAREFADQVGQLGVAVRAGIHTGEVEVMGDDIGGIAVHIAARVSAMAGSGQVFVTGTVRDLVVGSGLQFDDLGRHELKGVPGEWAVFDALGHDHELAERPLLATSTPATTPSDRVLTKLAFRSPRLARAGLHVLRRVSPPPTLADTPS